MRKENYYHFKWKRNHELHTSQKWKKTKPTMNRWYVFDLLVDNALVGQQIIIRRHAHNHQADTMKPWLPSLALGIRLPWKSSLTPTRMGAFIESKRTRIMSCYVSPEVWESRLSAPAVQKNQKPPPKFRLVVVSWKKGCYSSLSEQYAFAWLCLMIPLESRRWFLRAVW